MSHIHHHPGSSVRRLTMKSEFADDRPVGGSIAFGAVLLLYVVIIGSFAVYHLMKS